MKFKVGDKVRVKYLDPQVLKTEPVYNQTLHKVGTVCYVNPRENADLPYYVKFPELRAEPFPLAEDELGPATKLDKILD